MHENIEENRNRHRHVPPYWLSLHLILRKKRKAADEIQNGGNTPGSIVNNCYRDGTIEPIVRTEGR